MTTTQLTIPDYAKNAIVVGVKSALTEAASGGVGGKAEFPHISIEAGRWRLVDVEGEEQVLKQFAIQFALVAINPKVSKTFYLDKFVPGGERGAPQCSSDNGEVPYPDSEMIQSTQCAICPQNVWGSDVNPQNGNQLKRCKDAKNIALMFLGENLTNEHPEIYQQRLSAMSMINFSAFAKDVHAQGGALEYIVVQAEFDEKASYPLINYSVVRNLTAEEFEVVSRVRNEAVAPRAARMDQKVVPIMVERVQVARPLGIAAPAAESHAAGVADLQRQQQIAEATAKALQEDRQRELAAGKQSPEAAAAAEKARLLARAAELQAAAAKPVETPAQRELRELKEQIARLESGTIGAADAPDTGAQAEARDVQKVTDITPKVRQRHATNVTDPDATSPSIDDLIANAMGT